MSLLKHFFFRGASALPSRWVLQSAHLPVLLPYHHLVCDEHLPHISGIYPYKNERQFRSDLEWMLRFRKPIHPGQLAHCIQNRLPLPQGHFLLTFDDGLRQAAEVAAPMLQRMGIPAIFFINPAFIDNGQLFYRCKLSLILQAASADPRKRRHLRVLLHSPSDDLAVLRRMLLRIHYPQRSKADYIGAVLNLDFDGYLQQHRPFMSLQQVQQLESQGFAIGAHSMDHPHYGTIPLAQQIQQTEDSLAWVAKHTRQQFQLFSFPHQDAPVTQGFFDHFDTDSPFHPVFFGTQNQRLETHNRVLHRYNGEDPSRSGATMTKGVILQHYLQRQFRNDSVTRKPL